jgi:hypothetical protein
MLRGDRHGYRLSPRRGEEDAVENEPDGHRTGNSTVDEALG